MKSSVRLAVHATTGLAGNSEHQNLELTGTSRSGKTSWNTSFIFCRSSGQCSISKFWRFRIELLSQ